MITYTDQLLYLRNLSPKLPSKISYTSVVFFSSSAKAFWKNKVKPSFWFSRPKTFVYFQIYFWLLMVKNMEYLVLFISTFIFSRNDHEKHLTNGPLFVSSFYHLFASHRCGHFGFHNFSVSTIFPLKLAWFIFFRIVSHFLHFECYLLYENFSTTPIKAAVFFLKYSKVWNEGWC